MSLRENLEMVRERIARAAERSGRPASDVTLVAVTKKFPASVMRDAFELGLHEFGENYVQEFEGKFPELQSLLPQARFHLIGHLQSNKARKAAEMFRVIQTVDSVKLAQRLDGIGVKIDAMIEVKLSGEDSKEGAAPSDVPAIAEALRASRNLNLTGLMTMPPWSEDPEKSRPYFRQLATLARRENLPHLSMGMSHDLEAAIEEGATHVRVGTALFGRRLKH